MVYYGIALLISLLIDVLTVTFKTDGDKDLEILVLRHQLRILQRKVDKTPVWGSVRLSEGQEPSQAAQR